MRTAEIFGLLTLALLVFSMMVKPVKADGGIFYPDNYYAYETYQKAFVYFADKTETMVISAKFSGNAKDFSWVIPLPAKPEVDKSSASLFTSLENMTDTKTNSISGDSLSFGLSGVSQSASVEVISEKTIDMYDTAVLKATNENDLSAWLKSHGYSYPAGQDSALKSYVDNGWYFAIAKVQPTLVNDTKTGIALSTETITPLKFTFQTDKIIYPMKITGIALRSVKSAATGNSTVIPPDARPEIVSNRIPITLYVVSGSKVEQSSLGTDWANWLSESNLEILNTKLGGTKISGDKLFLTKMSAALSPEKIVDDFTILPVADNQIYPVPEYKTSDFWFSNLLFFAITILCFMLLPPIGLFFAVFVILQIFVNKKWLHITGNVYQVLACLSLPVIAIIFFLMSNPSSFSELILQFGFIGVAVAAVILEIVTIIFTIKMFAHYKSLFNNHI